MKAFTFDRDETLVWNNPPEPIGKGPLLKLSNLGWAICSLREKNLKNKCQMVGKRTTSDL